MTEWPSILAAILFRAAALALLVYWCTALVRVAVMLRRIPRLEQGLAHARAGANGAEGADAAQPEAVLIVPAHNEEAALERLLPSLRAQDYPRLRVVLCLDRCTDASRAVAERIVGGDARFRVLDIESCPEGWAGKVNAVWQGVRAVLDGPGLKPELLVFADADTIFHPACITAAVGVLRMRRLHALSLLSTMAYERWFERVVQPAAGMELMRWYPLDRVNRTRGRRRAFANGQFMLFRRDAYEAIGGHAAVRGELLEDMALARAVAEGHGGLGRADNDGQGGRLGLVMAGRFLVCRMYDDWAQFTRGWSRIYIEAAKRRVSRLRRGAHVCLWMGAVVPAVVAAGWVVLMARWLGGGAGWRPQDSAGLAVATLALAALAATLALVFRASRTPMSSILAFGVGSLLTARILWRSASDLARRVPVRWAGKAYVREPRP